MALGEGVEQVEEDFSDFESSDSEDEDILKAFEPTFPRLGKRTYGVLLDDLMAERRHKNAKLDEQLVFLRSIVPGTHEGEGGVSVLMDAFEYITKLSKSVDDLNTELVRLSNPAVSSSGYLNEEFLEASVAQPSSSGSTCVLYQHPMVVVKRQEGKMEVHIACINRPGLLVDIMVALDSKRITVLHARISCHQNVLFEALTLEKETIVLHAGPEPMPKEAVDEALKDIIVCAIRQDNTGNSSL